MKRQSLLIAFYFILASCEQSSQTPVSKEAADSAAAIAAVIKTETETEIETSASPEQMSEETRKHEANKEDIKVLPASLSSFVPAGYTALDTASGDLNLDQYTDMVMVLKKNGEDSTSDVSEHPEKRPLLILIGQADSSYKVAASNKNAVYCIDCGGIMGDPFMGIVIKHGFFSVEHYGGSALRWTRTITFRYSTADNNWYLYKDGHESFHSGDDPEKKETKIRTTKDFGKVPFDQFDIYKEDK